MTIHAAAGQIPPLPVGFFDDEDFSPLVSYQTFEGCVVEKIRFAGGRRVMDGAEG